MSGQLSEEAIAQMRQLFAAFCKDGSGKITAEQMIEGYKSMGAPMGEQEQQEIRKAMLAVDPSGGPISADDYLARMQMTDSAMDTFKMFDKDKSGFLDKSEIMQGMAQLGAEVTEEEAEKMLREADTDGDGKVSYEEFKASFQ
ncbi:uncharacterized protein LOC144872420 [Branchiostoma floridae x Branchiostoma japonicum]